MESYRVITLFEELWGAKIEPRLAKAKNLNAKQTEELLVKIIRDALRKCPFRERLNLRDDAKDNGRAAQQRKEGNKMFHPNVKRYIEAIKLYNETITLSEKGSEERALAYGNRSIICLEMQRYEECLENIRLARESNYPERLKEKLDERENSAKQALAKMADEKASSSKDSSEAVHELQLSYPSHENAPQIANCLELHKNDQYGRHVVTNRKLNVGDIVMIDKPYVTVLEEMLRCVRCDFCHAERLFTLIPCEGCSGAMYCSEECMSKAYNKYHRYECGVQRDLMRIFGDVLVFALRILATTIGIFDHDPEALKDHLEALDEEKVSSFTMDWRHATQKDIFNTVHMLTTNRDRRRCRAMAVRICNAVIIEHLVLEKTELGAVYETYPTVKNQLFDLFLRYQLIGEGNKQFLSFLEYNVDLGMYQDKPYAKGCYPLISMLNHSCASNVKRITLPDGRCAVFVVRPISEGDQLFDSYEMHHLLHRRTERQYNLKTGFIFQCTCEACMHDYPMIQDFRYDDMLSVAIVSKALQCHHDRKGVSKIMKYLRSYLNDTPRWILFPDAEVCLAQTHFQRSLQLLFSQISEIDKHWAANCNH